MTGILRLRVISHILFLPLLFVIAGSAAGQSSSLPPRPDTIRADKNSPSEDPTPLTTLEEEMRKKREIKYAEKEHRENLARADEIRNLGKGLMASYSQTKLLTREDLKTLDRLDKLTRKVRGEAGGEDNDITLDKPPADLDSAIVRIGKVTASLGEKVKDTPRQVISASVIDEANVLLELIRLVRNIAH